MSHTPSRWLLAATLTVASAAILALPAASTAAPKAIAIGTSQTDELAGVAVDAAGTAYIAWEDGSAAVVHYCKLPAGASSCSVTVALSAPQPAGGSGVLGSPSVIVNGSDVLVFAYDNANGNDNGEAGWVSTDGGSTFTQQGPGETMSYTPPNNDSTTTDPVSWLGNGLVGVGYVVPLGSPQFQAVQYDPLTGTYENNYNGLGTYGPWATLDPSNTYAAGNLGGEFGAVPIGASGAGVMGAIAALPSTAQDPCPSDQEFIGWAYAPLSAATTEAALNTSPGSAGSAWTNPFTKLDCNTEDPAVAGGAAGFGILDGAFSGGGTYYHRFNAGSDAFGPTVVISSDQEISPALSQDSAGGVYATWSAGLTELRLAYSPDGGTTWYGPVTLHDSGTNGLGDPASAVNGSGAGVAVYYVGATEYAQPFTKLDAILPPIAASKGTSNGKTVTLAITCHTVPCTGKIVITAKKPTDKHKTITVASGSFTITKRGAQKETFHLSGAGKAAFTAEGGHITGTIVAGVKVAGVTVTGPPHGFKISPSKSKH